MDLKQVTVFGDEAFNAIQIASKKQDGPFPTRTLYVNSDSTKVLVTTGDEVVKVITSADGSPLKIEDR